MSKKVPEITLTIKKSDMFYGSPTQVGVETNDGNRQCKGYLEADIFTTMQSSSDQQWPCVYVRRSTTNTLVEAHLNSAQ
jgi:hypothetical protein